MILAVWDSVTFRLGNGNIYTGEVKCHLSKKDYYISFKDERIHNDVVFKELGIDKREFSQRVLRYTKDVSDKGRPYAETPAHLYEMLKVLDRCVYVFDKWCGDVLINNKSINDIEYSGWYTRADVEKLYWLIVTVDVEWKTKFSFKDTIPTQQQWVSDIATATDARLNIWDRVIINRDKTSVAYRVSGSNPKGVTGTVTEVRSQIGLGIIVKWDNGTENCYNNYDLTVVWHTSPTTPTVPSEPLGKSVCQLIKEAESEKKVSTKDMPDWDIFATETSDITYL